MVSIAPDGGTEQTRADLSLLERIVARDQGAVAQLYDRHAGLLYGVILRILRNTSEAEEVLQEVFLLVWTRAESYDACLGAPVAWLVGIARNRAIDRLRASGVRARALDLADPTPPTPTSPEQSAADAEGRAAVLRALGCLSPEQRQLIEHAYYLGYTQSELAEHFQLPLGTVKTRIRAGMIALRQHLAGLRAELK